MRPVRTGRLRHCSAELYNLRITGAACIFVDFTCIYFFSIGRVRFYHMPPVFLAAVKRVANGDHTESKD